MKLVLPTPIGFKEAMYDTIFLDLDSKKTEAYCMDIHECDKYSRKNVTILEFGESYFETPLDWIEKITEAEKIDETTFQDRDAIRINTNIGIVSMEKYYAWIYRIEQEGKIWEFDEFVFNSVSDEDITPP